MSNMNDWEKQLGAIIRTTNMLNPVIEQMGAINRAGNMSATLKMLDNRMNMLNNANVLSGMWSGHFEAYETIRHMDLSGIFSIQDSYQRMIANFDFPAISTALGSFSKLDYASALANATPALSVYDSQKFSSAIQSVLGRLEWTSPVQISDILEEVTEQYIEDNEIDEAAGEEIREAAAVDGKELLTDKQRRVWEVYIYPFLVSLLFFILSLKQTQPKENNSIAEINNYYTVEMGIDVDVLNDYNFRIICEDNVMPRTKPDCSSRVVGHLSKGKVVCVVDKYKKWIEITWKNDDDEICSGWIQNYKVTSFK